MRIVRGISLFFVLPVLLLGIGFFGGLKCHEFFYPSGEWGSQVSQRTGLPEETVDPSTNLGISEEKTQQDSMQESAFYEELTADGYGWYDTEARTVSTDSETLCADTEYVVREVDILRNTEVEISGKLPGKYFGMDREKFVESMKVYEMAPPLAELERGFVSLEVLSFSRERVVVQMNYQYVQPSSNFYLGALNNEVVVYLEDKSTIYIYTGISMADLPESLQLEIIQLMWIENEESLYNFLEAYSS